MSGNHLQLYYHFVWATKNRSELINRDIEGSLYDYIGALCREMNVRVLAINGMPDHLHLVCSVPPTLPVSVFVKNVKSKSSYFVNRIDGFSYVLAWQPGYGALTFSKRDLATVVSYVRGQKEHHAANKMIPSMERYESLVETVAPDNVNSLE